VYSQRYFFPRKKIAIKDSIISFNHSIMEDTKTKDVECGDGTVEITYDPGRLDKWNLAFCKFVLGSVIGLVYMYCVFNMYIKYEELQLMKKSPERFEIRYTG